MTDILSYFEGQEIEHFGPCDTLLSEGSAGKGLFVLLEGTLAVTKEGVEVTRVSEPGALFGEMSALLGRPVSATVTAVTPVRVYWCPDPMEFIARTPEVAVHTSRLLATRLHNATHYLAEVKAMYGDKSVHARRLDRIMDAMLETPSVSDLMLGDPRDDPRL